MKTFSIKVVTFGWCLSLAPIWAADSSLTKERVAGGLHETKDHPTLFSNPIAADGDVHSFDATLNSKSTMATARVKAEDTEMNWTVPTRLEDVTTAKFAGTIKVASQRDSGYFSKFTGNVTGGAGAPGDPTFDFFGRLDNRPNALHKSAQCPFMDPADSRFSHYKAVPVTVPLPPGQTQTYTRGAIIGTEEPNFFKIATLTAFLDVDPAAGGSITLRIKITSVNGRLPSWPDSAIPPGFEDDGSSTISKVVGNYTGTLVSGTLTLKGKGEFAVENSAPLYVDKTSVGRVVRTTTNEKDLTMEIIEGFSKQQNGRTATTNWQVEPDAANPGNPKLTISISQNPK